MIRENIGENHAAREQCEAHLDRVAQEMLAMVRLLKACGGRYQVIAIDGEDAVMVDLAVVLCSPETALKAQASGVNAGAMLAMSDALDALKKKQGGVS